MTEAPHPVLDPARVVAATKRQQALLDAIREAGWRPVIEPHPGAVIFGHPDNDVELETPAYAREERPLIGAMYPFPTHHVLHQVTVQWEVEYSGNVITGEPARIKIFSVLTREGAAPWVHSHSQPSTLTKAIAWVREPHPGTAAREAREGQP